MSLSDYQKVRDQNVAVSRITLQQREQSCGYFFSWFDISLVHAASSFARSTKSKRKTSHANLSAAWQLLAQPSPSQLPNCHWKGRCKCTKCLGFPLHAKPPLWGLCFLLLRCKTRLERACCWGRIFFANSEVFSFQSCLPWCKSNT